MADETEAPLGDPEKSPVRWFPWVGIISLVTILVCAAASAILVTVSNDKAVETWAIPPAVWLAVVSAASNVAFSSALATGVAIRFWIHASRGTQLTQLHYIWDHGRGLGFARALRAGSEARKVTLLATLAYIAQFSSGPLLQRSTYQTTQGRVSEQTLYLDLADRIPDSWFGIRENGRATNTRQAMPQRQEWYRNDTILVPDKDGYHCDGGICQGLVRGAGFDYTCQSSTGHLDLSTNGSAL